MHTLQIHLGQVLYNMAYVGKSPTHITKKIQDALRDDPKGYFTLEDDFGQSVMFKPSDILGVILIDHERESEILIQRKLHEIKTNIDLQQRMAGDAKIKTAQMVNAGHHGGTA